MTAFGRPLVIVGPTASGKSGLALRIARSRPGTEIVSTDSMQVYRGMDIGTATPTAGELAQAPHHLINVVDPSDEFTVADFKARAQAALRDIGRRDGRALLAGGTGLYVRAVVDDLNIPGRYPEVMAGLDLEPDTATLHRRLVRLDPAAAARMEPSNRRRVLRALEVTIGSGKPFSSHGPGMACYPPTPFVQVGLRWRIDELDARIEQRLHTQMRHGFADEVRALAGKPLSRTARQALGYRELLAAERGEISRQEAIEVTLRRTRRFARRQMRWFCRDPRIVWLDAPTSAAHVLNLWESP